MLSREDKLLEHDWTNELEDRFQEDEKTSEKELRGVSREEKEEEMRGFRLERRSAGEVSSDCRREEVDLLMTVRIRGERRHVTCSSEFRLGCFLEDWRD